MEALKNDGSDVLDWKAPVGVVRDGIKYPTFPFIDQVLDEIESGDVPEFNTLVATYPRPGNELDLIFYIPII